MWAFCLCVKAKYIQRGNPWKLLPFFFPSNCGLVEVALKKESKNSKILCPNTLAGDDYSKELTFAMQSDVLDNKTDLGSKIALGLEWYYTRRRDWDAGAVSKFLIGCLNLNFSLSELSTCLFPSV